LKSTYGLKLTQIVADFVKDAEGKAWLTDVKYFDFDSVERIRNLDIIKKSKQERQALAVENFERARQTAKCTLCCIYHERSKVQNIITKGMLHSLEQHLAQRGVFGLTHLSKLANLKDFCKVCKDCHRLVLAEQELQEVEQLFSLA